MTEPLSVREEAVRRVTRVIQEVHGAWGDIAKSTAQARLAIDVIRDLLADDTCPRCHGSGELYEGVCGICTGQGWIREAVTVGPIDDSEGQDDD